MTTGFGRFSCHWDLGYLRSFSPYSTTTSKIESDIFLMNAEPKKLKCLSKDPHEAHNWVFKWDRPQIDYRCPGVEKEED